MVCYAKIYKEPYEFAFADDLDTVAEIRGRIMHPRCAADMDVSDEDIAKTWAATEAIIEDLNRLFSICNKKA